MDGRLHSDSEEDSVGNGEEVSGGAA
jgi:hypothetical protein